MSDTPRTESEVNRQKCWSDDLITIDANFACQLERELNAANDRIKRLEEAYEGEIGEQPELLGSNVMGLLKRELNFAQKRIKRLEEAGVWQPIETAPTDKTWVIGYDAKDGEVGTIIFDLTGDVDDEDVHYEWTDGMRTLNPTHWMPLPEPPEAKEAKP